eukprot:g17860.t1
MFCPQPLPPPRQPDGAQLTMLQQRRSFTSSSGDRRGRQQQQASRSRTTSVWEVVFLVVLLIVTGVNLYTYNDRRERFQRARGTSDLKPATGKSLQIPPSDSHRHHFGKKNSIGGGVEDGEPGPSPGGIGDGRTAPNLTQRFNSAAAASAGGGEIQGGGDKDGSVAAAAAGGGVGGSSTNPLPPPARPIPLGRDRPLQIMAAAPGASSLRGSAAEAGGGGGRGEGSSWRPDAPAAGAAAAAAAATETDAVVHFACSLTEVDYAPGQETRGNMLRRNQKQSWTTSGPCMISCSPTSPAEGGSSSLGPFEYCARAVRACELYQECTHVLLPPPPNAEGALGDGDGNHSGGSGLAYATLMHRPAEDGSMAGVEAAAARATRAAGAGGGGWGGSSGGFTLEQKRRTYYVVSFGGSGSKMLGGWLSERDKSMVQKVFHFHDPRPADKLFVKLSRQSVSSGRTAGKGKDFRDYVFPEGVFPVMGAAVGDVDSYRVVFIFKDPVEALVSRYFYNHCKNIKGAECGATPAEFPSLERYAEEVGDRLLMETFYDNYCDPVTVDRAAAKNGGKRRNFPVVCVNYHKMWDNKEALVRALGLPAGEAFTLPERAETVRNDQTSEARGEPFTLAMRERLRRKHASLSEKVFGAPAITIV